jgi:hypothetical protein
MFFSQEIARPSRARLSFSRLAWMSVIWAMSMARTLPFLETVSALQTDVPMSERAGVIGRCFRRNLN